MKHYRSAVALSFLLLLLAPRSVVIAQSEMQTPQQNAQGLPFDGSRGSFPGCPQCGLWSWVDKPEDQATVFADDFILKGWGFECVSGTPVTRIDVLYQDYEGAWRTLKQETGALTPGVSRWDVTRAFYLACPNVTQYAGWHLHVTGMPLGLRRVRIIVWHGAYLENHFRTYLVRQTANVGQ